MIDIRFEGELFIALKLKAGLEFILSFVDKVCFISFLYNYSCV